MAKKDVDYNQKDFKELSTLLDEKEKQLIESSMGLAERKTKDLHDALKIRREIARIKTAVTRKKEN